MEIETISHVALWIFMLGNMLLTVGLARRINSLPTRVETLKIGQHIPDLVSKLRKTSKSEISEIPNGGLALVFVSPNCEPCKIEMPGLHVLQQLATEHDVWLGVVTDASEQESRDYVRQYISNQEDLNLVSAPRTENSLLRDLKVVGTPSYYYFDSEHRLAASGTMFSALADYLREASRRR